MKTAFTASMGGLLTINLLLTGCQPASTDVKNTRHANPSTSATKDAVASPPTSVKPDDMLLPTDTHSNPSVVKNTISNSDNNDDIAKRLEITYARNAAYKKDECPKLVEFESLDQTVTREGEQLPSDFCEYFVFLNKGDTLRIQTSSDMQAKLISPIWFDFANGSYTADKFDKYTIRLSYNGVRYHPTNFRYDVSLIKSGIKPD